MKLSGYITASCFYILIGALCAKMGYNVTSLGFWFFSIPANTAAFLICKKIFKQEKAEKSDK
jgi:hypothetical protein